MNHLVAPSMLSANFGNLAHDVEIINKSRADWFHLDIMDGVFVPNISFGFPVISYIKSVAKKPLDVHLMIVDPDRYLSRFSDAGASILTVHLEACTHLNRTAAAIRELGMKAGVSINPHTPVSALKNILPYIDLVLVMSVNPGFGGQKFIPDTYNKIKELRQMAGELNNELLIEVDGGVGPDNAAELVAAGADVLVAGNSIFSSGDIPGMISTLKDLKKV